MLAAYWPGLDGPFLFDDLTNFVANPRTQPADASAAQLWVAVSGYGETSYYRGLAFLSFAVHYLAGGQQFDAFSMKVTNALIHSLNGLLVFLLVARFNTLYRARCGLQVRTGHVYWSALLAAVVWAVHPLQLSAVLLVVQRMTSLSAMAVLLGLLVYLYGRSRLVDRPWLGVSLMAIGAAGGTVVGFGFKENAILLPVLCLLCDAFLFDRKALSRPLQIFVSGYFLVAAVVVLAACALLATAWQEWLLAPYERREFSLVERVLTQARVLFSYLESFFLPSPAKFALFHDGVPISRSLQAPWTTLPAVLGWVVLVPLAVYGALRRHPIAFGLLWFLAAHALESTVIGLELVFEHRNYVPTVGLVAGIAMWAGTVSLRLDHGRLVPAVASACVVAMLALMTASRAHTWADKYTLLEAGVRNHPNSARYHTELAQTLVEREGDIERAYPLLVRSTELDPQSIVGLMAAYSYIRYLQLVRDGQLDWLYAGSAEGLADKQAALDQLEALDAPAKLERLDALVRRGLTQVKPEVSTVGFFQRVMVENHFGPQLEAAVLPTFAEWAHVGLTSNKLGEYESEFRFLLGDYYRGDGRTELAIDYMRQAAEMVPSKLNFTLNLMELLIREGHLDEAAEYHRLIGTYGVKVPELVARIEAAGAALAEAREQGE